MKIYEDRELNKEIESFDFGIIPAGDIETFTYYLFNNSNAFLRNLEFNLEHSELQIIKAPTELFAQAIAELVIEWNCKVDIKRRLKKQNYI
ncbi:unnamed protein product [marine sediment metagenome]|uniref:Uncharacterized protein n=1 Tax=marine sediment metagenome TaxID=412755 RepID=X1B9Q7_9ZZZZ